MCVFLFVLGFFPPPVLPLKHGDWGGEEAEAQQSD